MPLPRKHSLTPVVDDFSSYLSRNQGDRKLRYLGTKSSWDELKCPTQSIYVLICNFIWSSSLFDFSAISQILLRFSCIFLPYFSSFIILSFRVSRCTNNNFWGYERKICNGGCSIQGESRSLRQPLILFFDS